VTNCWARMRKLVSSRAALAADKQAETEFTYPSLLLMEEAGIRLQDRLEGLFEEGVLAEGPVVYLAGPGNNGGDALVMARQAFLRGRRKVTVVSVLPPHSESCVWQTQVAQKVGIPLGTWPDANAKHALEAAAVWVDGIFGAGLTGKLRAEREELLRQLESLRQELNKPVVAVDVPSGLWEGWSAQAVVTARLTLSPGWPKDFCFYPGARAAAGTIVAVPLAFPREAESSADLIEEADLPELLPQVSRWDHKGKRGHVALLGGAHGMTGALILASRSAAAAGAGLVSLGVDSELLGLIAPQVPAFQVRTPEDLISRAARYDAWVAGPGWGRGEDRVALLSRLWSTDLPLVLDADGLWAWSVLRPARRRAPVVMTPHPGEFLRLGEFTAATVAEAESLAQAQGVVVVLKGAATWIVGSGRRAVWDGPNAALGTGGSGDCLAGVVGALLARGLSAFEAAVAAVALHGAAGRELATRSGWFTADELPAALARTSAACALRLGQL